MGMRRRSDNLTRLLPSVPLRPLASLLVVVLIGTALLSGSTPWGPDGTESSDTFEKVTSDLEGRLPTPPVADGVGDVLEEGAPNEGVPGEEAPSDGTPSDRAGAESQAALPSLPSLGGSTPEPTPAPSADPTPTPSSDDSDGTTDAAFPGPDTDVLGYPNHALVRLEIDSTSDWATVELLDTRIASHVVVEESTGAEVTMSKNRFLLKGSAPASGVVETVLAVRDGANPVLRVRKGAVGTVEATLVRLAGEETVLATVENDQRDDDPTVYTRVERSVLVGPGVTVPLRDARRLTLAFYYPWFHQKRFDSGLWWEKPAGPYDTSDPDEVRKMVARAKDHGVDGFVVSYDGDANAVGGLELVRRAAEERGDFHFAPLLELRKARDGHRMDLDKVEGWVRDILSRWGDEEAFLRVDGRPVMYTFGSWELEPAEWKSLLSRFSDTVPFFVGDTNKPRYLGMDGGYRYSPNDLGADRLRYEYDRTAERFRFPSRLDASVPQPLWAGTVSPGMNDSYTRPTSPTIRSRDDGARYDAVWSATLNSRPEWVMVTSWNEWYEATHIQEGQRTGMRALRQTSSWNDRFGYG